MKSVKRSNSSSLYTTAREVNEWIRIRKHRHPSRRDFSRYRVHDPRASLLEHSTLERSQLNEVMDKLPDSELLSALQATASCLFSTSRTSTTLF